MEKQALIDELLVDWPEHLQEDAEEELRKLDIDDLDSLVDEYIELGDYQRAAVHWLFNDIGYSLPDAIEKADQVIITDGSIDNIVYNFISDTYNIPDNLLWYFDTKAFFRDMELNGQWATYDKYIILNADEF